MKDSPAPGNPLKRFLSCWAVGFLCIHISFGQINSNPSGARSAGLSNSSVALTDGWSSFNNQAGLGYITPVTVSFFFENKYQLQELSQRDGFIVIPVHSGGVAVTIRYFGFPNYYETKYGLGYGVKILPWLAMGVQINLLQNYIADGFGKTTSLAGESGLLISPVKNFRIGIHYTNLSAGLWKNHDDIVIPQILRVGLTYSLLSQALFALEWENWFGHSQQLKGGIEFPLLVNFFFRCGYSSGSGEYSLGAGYKKNSIIADMAFTRHPVLGFTPQLSFGYEF